MITVYKIENVGFLKFKKYYFKILSCLHDIIVLLISAGDINLDKNYSATRANYQTNCLSMF